MPIYAGLRQPERTSGSHVAPTLNMTSNVQGFVDAVESMRGTYIESFGTPADWRRAEEGMGALDREYRRAARAEAEAEAEAGLPVDDESAVHDGQRRDAQRQESTEVTRARDLIAEALDAYSESGSDNRFALNVFDELVRKAS